MDVAKWKTIDDYLVQMHKRMYEAMTLTRQEVPAASLEDLTDVKHFVRRASDSLNELRKDMDKLGELIDVVANAKWVSLGDGAPEQFVGRYATGTTDVKMKAAPPPKDSKEYQMLLDHFGIPDAARGGLVELHYPTLCERLTEGMKKGAPLPPGLDPDKQAPKFTLKTKAHR